MAEITKTAEPLVPCPNVPDYNLGQGLDNPAIAFVVATAVALGILYDALLRAFPWGLNAALWTIAFVAALMFLHRQCRAHLAGGRAIFLPLVVVFGLSIAWRDSTTLKWLDVLMVGAMMVSIVLRPMGINVRQSHLGHYVYSAFLAFLEMLVAPIMLSISGTPRTPPLPGERRDASPHGTERVTAILLGVIITIPLLSRPRWNWTSPVVRMCRA